MSINLKDHVSENKMVRFSFYKDGLLFYKTENGLLFEVPITETGNGSFNFEDKAIFYMRWIRKQLENNEEGKRTS